jgi:hypothetical protein
LDSIPQQRRVHCGHTLLWAEERVAKAALSVCDIVKDFWENHLWLGGDFSDFVVSSVLLGSDFLRGERGISNGVGDE